MNVCPNCGGGFVPRPIRPKALLVKYPSRAEIVYKPVDFEKHALRLRELRDIDPRDR
jgi:hypothetical protein